MPIDWGSSQDSPTPDATASSARQWDDIGKPQAQTPEQKLHEAGAKVKEFFSSPRFKAGVAAAQAFYNYPAKEVQDIFGTTGRMGLGFFGDPNAPPGLLGVPHRIGSAGYGLMHPNAQPELYQQ